MSAFDIYGLLNIDLESAKTMVESVLGLKLQAHDSSYRGGSYYRQGTTGEENFILQNNIDLIDGEPIDFPQYPILLYINHTDRSFEIRQMIESSQEKMILLKHNEL